MCMYHTKGIKEGLETFYPQRKTEKINNTELEHQISFIWLSYVAERELVFYY